MRLDDADDAALLAATDLVAERFAVFYRRHVDTVLRFLARRGVDAATAADLTAEVFATAYLQRRRYEPRRGDARAWLLTIAARRHADLARRWSREKRAVAALALQVPALTEDDVAGWSALVAAVEELPAGQREAVRERVLEDRAYDDIAARQGLSEAAVRQRVSRGLATLRTRLEDDR
ncbi:RNA polymerase sigma factor [Conexibacter sp. SYSU D00693]|uniref:RNA polymerase sigma factor n=1 Tax=Conexibacter sp. SYSU D00693 TaxID=2812560 RepID=UPI00196A4722|nr:RNA polymerase sigma factor [Conexibacter sp. SYSU D00693]